MCKSDGCPSREPKTTPEKIGKKLLLTHNIIPPKQKELMKIRSTTLDHHEEPPIGDVRGDVSLSPLKCLITPETPPRRLSYLPSSPQGRKIIPPLVTCSTPSTPTHGLRPAMESLESPLMDRSVAVFHPHHSSTETCSFARHAGFESGPLSVGGA